MKRWFRYFILFFVISFCYSYFFTCVYTDEIWNYGFSYNIANGLVPYRDFNMVITPLYHMLVSIFINIFGHHLYALHIFNSFVVASILLIFVYKLGKKGLLLFSFVFLNIYPGYNIFCVLLILILLNLCDKEFRYKDILMGILVGIFFLIKQNVGFCLFIPMIYYSRNRIKSFISFCIPVFIFLIYLIWNNALYQFIDYCFLGLFEFGDSNSIFLFLPVELVVCATLGYKLLKSKFIKQQLFYLLMYQIITIPIVDDYHFMIGFIPVFYYYLFNRMIVTYKLKYYFLMVLSFCGLWNFSVRGYEVGHLYSDKNSYLNGRNVPSYVEDIVDGISNYIEEKKDDYDYIFFFSSNAYYVKLNIEYPLTKFDLINNGNMGYRGSSRYIDEIDTYCRDQRCLFILYKVEFREGNISQTNRDLVNYVQESYLKKEKYGTFDIYNN